MSGRRSDVAETCLTLARSACHPVPSCGIISDQILTGPKLAVPGLRRDSGKAWRRPEQGFQDGNPTEFTALFAVRAGVEAEHQQSWSARSRPGVVPQDRFLVKAKPLKEPQRTGLIGCHAGDDLRDPMSRTISNANSSKSRPMPIPRADSATTTRSSPTWHVQRTCPRLNVA